MEQIIQRITNELRNAYNAEDEGKHGLARVCARRAAGWAIQYYLFNNGIDLQSSSVLDQIKYFKLKRDNSPEIQIILEHLLVKVSRDSIEQDSYWPLPDVDLVKEAHFLSEQMLGEAISIDV